MRKAFSASCVHRLLFLAVLVREVFEEVFDEQGDVLHPLAEGRDAERDDVQLEEQVLPETALGDELLQALARGGQDPGVDRHRFRGADRLALAFLDDPDELGLGLEAHLADLVEKQSPAVGQKELALLVLDGVRRTAP